MSSYEWKTNEKQRAVWEGRDTYHCPKCGAEMEFEDENESVLICTECNYDMDSDRYGFTDEEYEDLYSAPIPDDLLDAF